MKTIKPYTLAMLVVLATAGFVQTTALAAPDGKAVEEKKAAQKEAGVKPYPLDVCIVTDNDLGSMGEETRMVYEGQEIKFCCKPCEKKFLKNPAKFLEKIAPKST